MKTKSFSILAIFALVSLNLISGAVIKSSIENASSNFDGSDKKNLIETAQSGT